jgi:hypothetical protein
MLQDHKDILKNSIKDAFSLQDKFSDFEINSNFQSLISQLDLFKVVASLEIGIIGIGYLYDSKLNGNFLLISLISALFTLVLSISYTREVIDSQSKQNQKTHAIIKQKVQEHNDVVIEAFKKDDSEIFFEYARNESERKHLESPLNYMGEIIIFCFYLSVGFLGLSFVSYKYPIELVSVKVLLLLIAIFLISFKDWSMQFSKILSTPVKNIFKRRFEGEQ